MWALGLAGELSARPESEHIFLRITPQLAVAYRLDFERDTLYQGDDGNLKVVRGETWEF